MPSRSPLVFLVRRAAEREPVDVARDLEAMDETAAADLLKVLPAAVTAGIFPHLQPTHAATLLQGAPPELAGEIVERMPPELAAGVLIILPQEQRQALVDRLPESLKGQLRDLLTYPENSAGRIMSTDFLALHATSKVRDAVQRIRAAASKRAPTTYAYVVDEANRLVGVLNMRDLLLASGEATLDSIMKTDLFSVDGFMDREEVAHELSNRRFFAVPVIDAQRRLVGIVKTHELLGDVQEEATEDILKMVGAGGDERAFSPIRFSLMKRLPWLHVNLATAFLAAAVVAMFEGLIAKVTVLAVLLPVVAGQGGNAGAQSLAVVMRGLVMREIRPANAMRVIFKEGYLGALNGLIIGLVTAALAWLWKGNPMLGLVIGLGMAANLTAAGLAGAAIPLGMKALGRDPAQSSNIILTTVTDVVGFLAFLGFAMVFQRHLM